MAVGLGGQDINKKCSSPNLALRFASLLLRQKIVICMKGGGIATCVSTERGGHYMISHAGTDDDDVLIVLISSWYREDQNLTSHYIVINFSELSVG